MANSTPVATSTQTPTAMPNSTSEVPAGELTVSAEFLEDKTLITWNFTADRETLWFRVYRSESPEFTNSMELTTGLIPAIFSGNKLYQFEDKSALTDGVYYYWVEQLFVAQAELHGPADIVVSGSGQMNNSIYLPVIEN